MEQEERSCNHVDTLTGSMYLGNMSSVCVFYKFWMG